MAKQLQTTWESLGPYSAKSWQIRYFSIYFSSLDGYILKCLKSPLAQWLSNKTTPSMKEWRVTFFLALFPAHFCPNTKHVLPPLFPSISSRLQGRESDAVAIGDVLMMCKDRKTWWKTFYTRKPCKHLAGAWQHGGAGPTWCFMWGLQPLPALQAGLEPLNKRRDQRQESVQTSFYN